MNAYEHLLRISLSAARGGRGVLSTGEHLGAAMVLNRPDWLHELGYTLPEALARLDDDWIALIPRVARAVTDELAQQAQAADVTRQALGVSAAFTSKGNAGSTPLEPVDFDAALITYGHAPGYRDLDLELELRRRDAPAALRARVRLSAKDGVAIMQHIREVHESAWRGGEPIDVLPGETLPEWLRPDVSAN